MNEEFYVVYPKYIAPSRNINLMTPIVRYWFSAKEHHTKIRNAVVSKAIHAAVNKYIKCPFLCQSVDAVNTRAQYIYKDCLTPKRQT